MCFKGADCTFICISNMDMGRYQFLSHYLLRLDDALVFSTCFVIQYLEVYQNVAVLETLRDGTIGE